MYYRIDFILREALKLADGNIADLDARCGTGSVGVASVLESVLPEVASRVIEREPLSRLDESVELDCAPEDHGDGTGHIVLPEDFLRLRAFQMSDWDYPVENPLVEDDRYHTLQRSGHAGLRGNPRRPVVALSHRDGFRTLEYYTTFESPARILTARYIPKPLPDASGRVRIPQGVLRSVIRELALEIENQ